MDLSEGKRSKVLILLNRVPYPLNDGGAIGSFNFVKGYAEAGCEVTILAMNTTKHFVAEDVVQHAFSKYGRIFTVPIDNTIKLFAAFKNLFTGGSYVIERFSSPAFREELIGLLKNDYDIIHLDGLPGAIYIDVIRKYSKAKVVIRAHNVEHMIWQRIAIKEENVLKRTYLNIQAERLKAFETAALKAADLVLAISKEDETAILQLDVRTTVLVVPAGRDIEENMPATNSVNDLFFIGAFDWMPNLQGIEWFFTNIWQSIDQQVPGIRFYIAGKNMPPSVAGLKSDRVIPVGEVPDSKEFILQHGVMIVPIVSGSGVRIKIIEAMALGKVIIATTIAAEGLGATNGVNILLADNGKEFVAQINKCLNDINLRNRIGENAHKYALENFQNKRIFQKLKRYYEQIN